MKSMAARFAEMTDKQIVASYMTLVGMIWAYNETDYFIDRDTELNRLRREAKTLRYGDPRRAKLIRSLGGLPDNPGFGPPDPELVPFIVTGTTPPLSALDAEAVATA